LRPSMPVSNVFTVLIPQATSIYVVRTNLYLPVLRQTLLPIYMLEQGHLETQTNYAQKEIDILY
ncbi:hypothetical protein, partial [Endozoicomonas sp. SESOKO3]|uniref:hypothetical protein n=1 Tax=Endozoicomonas sp. SESOKO3 TaxID=2828744 RepID=UPI002148EA46